LRLFSSESVTAGHPDKMCDCISDAILDACLSVDPNARVAAEIFVKGLDPAGRDPPHSFIVVGGEVTLAPGLSVDFERIARETAAGIGYDSLDVGMDATSEETCQVIVLVTQQSEEISQGITEGEGLHSEQGAGDQGIMFGYATNESESYPALRGTYMPLPILLAQRLTSALTDAMQDGTLNWARPDGKSQVTVAYNDKGRPSHVDTAVIAVQHDDLASERFGGDVEKERALIQKEVGEKVIRRVIPEELVSEDMKMIVNGTGRFVKGGPHADAGLTGRKIIVDTYGGMGAHGGGAFSGKDPSKVDRSACYAARWAAKHVVASGLAGRCEIQLAYAIGIAEPVSINLSVNTFGTARQSDTEIERKVRSAFDFRPSAIIEALGLRDPIYSITASGGHFGRNPSDGPYFPWETLDSNIIEQLKISRTVKGRGDTGGP